MNAGWGDFTLEIQLDFTLKSGGFHPWNLVDFTQISPVKSTQNYIKQVFQQKLLSLMNAGWGISPVKSGRFHPDFTCEINPNYKSKCFSKNSSVWWMQGGGFHPWNPVDFTLKSGGYHPWNLVDFTQISPVKIHPKIIKASVSAKNSSVLMNAGWGISPFEIQWISPWNMVDFTHEIWLISPRFHLWNPPKL